MPTTASARSAMFRPISTTRVVLLGALLLAALLGGVVGFLLPHPTAHLVIESGVAVLNGDGTGGSFQADSGVTAMLPAEVGWVSTPADAHNVSRPDCLWDGWLAAALAG